MKKIIKVALALLVVFSLFACSSNGGDTDTTIVKVGVVGAYNDQWDKVNEILKDEGIQVELVYFSEYTLPNNALAHNEIDLNAFQHLAYLENEINTFNYDITPIGNTLIAPLGVFNNKNKIDSIDDIKDGDKIAIPSDPTNGGRALKILEEIGLIEIDEQAGLLPTKVDITKYNVQIDIIEAESGTLASLLPDCTAALINGGNAFTAGLNPTTDTIYVENIDLEAENTKRLINIIVARTSDVDNAVYQRIVEVYHSDEVANTIIEAYDGAFIPVK